MVMPLDHVCIHLMPQVDADASTCYTLSLYQVSVCASTCYHGMYPVAVCVKLMPRDQLAIILVCILLIYYLNGLVTRVYLGIHV